MGENARGQLGSEGSRAAVPMKMVAEYLDKAITFERLADAEKDAKAKAELIAQAKAYRKLATERAERLGMNKPSRRPT
jgi:hypothetical protein